MTGVMTYHVENLDETGQFLFMQVWSPLGGLTYDLLWRFILPQTYMSSTYSKNIGFKSLMTTHANSWLHKPIRSNLLRLWWSFSSEVHRVRFCTRDSTSWHCVLEERWKLKSVCGSSFLWCAAAAVLWRKILSHNENFTILARVHCLSCIVLWLSVNSYCELWIINWSGKESAF